MRVGALNGAAIAALTRDPKVLAAVEETVAVPLAQRMTERAPKASGAGADSIQARPLPDNEPGFAVGWDRDHFYLGFAELGTEHQPARPFARPAADEFTSS